MKTTQVWAAIAWASVVGVPLIQTAHAADESERYASTLAFAAADQDGDGRVNEAEVASDTAAGFSSLDTNGNEFEPQELGAHSPAVFKRLDADGNGRLSLLEVMEHKLKVMKDADGNGDGTLSEDEVIYYDLAH